MFIVRNFILWSVCFFLIACGLTTRVLQHQSVEKNIQMANLPVGSRSLSFPVVEGQVDYGAYLAGLMARNHQDIETMTNYLMRVLKTDPDNVEVLEEVYFFNMIYGRFDQAIPFAERLNKLKQNGLFVDHAILTYWIQQGHYKEVLTALDQKEFSSFSPLFEALIRAWTLAGLHQTKDAITALSSLNTKEMKSLYLYHAGLIYNYAGQPEKAEKLFKQLEKTDIPSPTAFLFIPAFFEKGNQWNDTNPLFQKYGTIPLDGDPLLFETVGRKYLAGMIDSPQKGIAEVLFEGSLTEETKGDIPRALLLNVMMRALDKESFLGLVLGGRLYTQLQNYDLAFYLYNQIKSPNEITLFNKVFSLLMMKQPDQALEQLKQMSPKSSQYPVLLAMLGGVYAEMEQYQKALEIYNQLLPLVQNILPPEELAQIYSARGLLLWKNNKEAEGTCDFVLAWKLDPKNPIILNQVGYMWVDEESNIEQGVQLLEEANRLSPKDPFYMDSLAWGYFKQKKYEKALPLAEKATDLMPGSSLANAHLGEIYLALGRKREAFYQFEKALMLDSDLTPDLKSKLQEQIQTLSLNNK